MSARLAGTMVVVSLAANRGPELARALSREGASVVLISDQDDARAAGRLAEAIEEEPGRVAVFCDDDPASFDTDALIEFVAEMRPGYIE